MQLVPNSWKVGDVILDLYKVTNILGEGGFGKVYQVRHQGWNIDLAVKSPKPEIVAAKGGVENFEREAETWVNLGLHPHIVSCYYVRRMESSPLVFAEYVAGGSLEDWICDRRLYANGVAASLRRILDIGIQLAWGLHYAHEQGLIHQDVKPENAMLTPEGAVKVTDFGLANARTLASPLNPPLGKEGKSKLPLDKGLGGSAGDRTLIVAGSGAMTPAYCSPEQAKGESLTRRTDLWSWALSVLEMFQGERTWQIGTIAARVLEFYLETGSQDPLLPQMPLSVAQLLRRCFRENPDERPRTMLEVARELQAIYQQKTGEAYPRIEPKAGKDIADSLNNRAVSLLDLGRQDEAMQLWEQALSFQPQHPESTYNRGLMLWRAAKITDETLLREMEEVRKSQAGNWVVDYILGLVHLERDDCEAAIKTLSGIQGAGAQHEEVQAALAIARERLPNSKRLLRNFEGQTGGMNSVCLSGDSRFALSGSWKNTVNLWDVTTGRCLRTFEGHRGSVTSVCLSRDSQFAVSGSDDNTVKLWEVATGCCLRTFKGHTDEITSVCLSAGSRFALSGSDDKTLKLWEVDRGRCLCTFKGHADEVTSVCLSAHSRLALSGSRDKTLKLWEVDTGGCLRTFEGHASSITSVCLSADSQLALSGSSDSTMKLWEVATGRCLRTFEGQTREVTSVALSADNRFALSGSNDKTLKLWEVDTGRCLRTFEGHSSVVTSVCLSANSQFALSSEIDDKSLKLWAVNCSTTPYVAPMMLSRVLATETVLSLNQTYERELEQAKAALDRGEYVVAAQHMRKARSQPGYNRRAEAVNAWASLYIRLPRKALSGSWEGTGFSGHTSWISSLCVSADNRLVLSGSGDKTLKLWEVATGRCLHTFEGHKDEVTSVCLSADSRFALSGSKDNTVKLWEVATGRCLPTIKGHKGYKGGFISFEEYKGQGAKVTSVCLSTDSRFVLVGSNDKTLMLCEATTGRILRISKEHTDEITSICLSADSRVALSGSRDRTIKLWEVRTGCCLHTFQGHSDEVTSICLSADSRFALSGSRDQTLKLWSVSKGYCLFILKGHTKAVSSVCLSLDGRYALSGSWDNTVKLWEVAKERCLRTFEGYTQGVTSVCLSQDGRYAVSGSVDGTLKLWVLDWELEDKAPADWDEGARVYLETFLTQHTPYNTPWWRFRTPVPQRRGTPTWTEEDFQNLLYTLGCAGYGWLRPESVCKQLEAMAGIEPKSSPKEEGERGRGGEGEIGRKEEELINEQIEEQSSVEPSSVSSVINQNPPIPNPKSQIPNPQMSAKVKLTVIEGSLKGREFVFDSRTTCIIGRAHDCNPQLPSDKDHENISRYHCLLDINPPTARVRDLGSLQGTYVNGQIIGQRQPNQTPEEVAQMNFPEYDLKTGDKIKLGNTVFQVSIEGASEAEATEPLARKSPPASTKSLPSGQRFVPQVNFDDPNFPVLQGYTTLKLLGKGGFGAVYLARHNQTKELVALKVMLPKVATNQWAVEMFLREIENTKALQHPNVVQLWDYGYSDNTFFLTLEYCDSGSVADLMWQRGGRLSIDEAVPIILQALDGLDYAHNAEIPYVKRADGKLGRGRGLVHRDLKPANIFLANVSGTHIAKNGDYGLAKAFDLAGLSGLSMSGTTGGTPNFMPRQQVLNFKYAKPEVDVWAMAASLYNMLTGTYPRNFIGDPFRAVLQTNAVPIRQRDTSIPKPLAELIDLALVDNPNIHFKNAAAFKRALLSVL